jgi:integrase
MSGTGSVYQERGKWVAQLSIGPRSQRRFLRRTRATRRDALEALADLHAKPATSKQTLGAYLAEWVRDVRNLRPETRRSYANVIRFHLIPTIGDVHLADLSPVHVERMLAIEGPRVAPKTLRNIHAVLRRALTMALRQGLVTRNVAAREYVDPPRVPAQEPQAYTGDEVRRLIDACRGDRLEALYVTAVGTGLRQGELLGLAWEDVDLDGSRISVRRELAKVDGRYQRVEPKTPQSRRAVPLSASVQAALIAHRGRTIVEGFIPTATGPVFVNGYGQPLSGSWVTHHLYRLEGRAGLRRLSFHALRRTFASRLAEAGVADIEIARLLGHARTHVTKQHYIAAGPTPAAALSAIEAIVNVSPNGSPSMDLSRAE